MAAREANGTALVAAEEVRQELAQATRREPGIELAPGVLVSIPEARALCKDLMESSTLPEYIKGAGDVFAAMLKSAQWGLPLMAVIEGCSFIKGKVSPSAHLTKAIIMHSGLLEQWVVDSRADGCKITVQRKGFAPREYSFEEADARAAGLLNDMYKKYPRQMYEARATTMAGRGEFPDLLAGAYAPEELADSAPPAPAPAEAPAEAAQSTDAHTRRTLYAIASKLDEELPVDEYVGVVGELVTALALAWRDRLINEGGETDTMARAAIAGGLISCYAQAETEEHMRLTDQQVKRAKGGAFVDDSSLAQLREARSEAVQRVNARPVEAEVEGS